VRKIRHIKTHNEFIKDYVLVEYELFTLCDKSCSYCYNVAHTEGKRYNNELDKVLQTLQNIMSMDNKKIIIELIGGEPLLHKHFNEIVEFLWDNKHPEHKFSILTHADHPKEFFQNRMELLKKFGDNFRVTCTLHIEGLNKERFLDNIKWVNENFKYSNLFFFTDNRYLEEIEFVEQVFKSLTTMKLQPLILDKSKDISLIQQMVNMSKKFESFEHLMDTHYEIDGKVIPYNKAKIEMYKYNQLTYTGQSCKIRAYEVDKNGDITMCCFRIGDKPMGNLLTNFNPSQLNSEVITCPKKVCQTNMLNFEVTDEKRTT